MVTITIGYGDDVHRINVSDAVYADIKAGKLVEIDGQGMASEDEDRPQRDHWIFNHEASEVYIWLDNGAEFYGDILSVEPT